MERTLRQQQNQLNTLYFSQFNLNVLQAKIRKEFREKTGISIDRQKEEDLLSIMRSIYINNAVDPYAGPLDLRRQVDSMNEQAAKLALGQISTGVSQYIGYLRDINGPIRTMPLPVNTSSYGEKLPQVPIGLGARYNN